MNGKEPKHATTSPIFTSLHPKPDATTPMSLSKSSSTSHSWFKRHPAAGAKENSPSSTSSSTSAGRALTTLKAFRVGSLSSKSSASSSATSRLSPSVYTLPLPSPGEPDSHLSPFAATSTTKGSSLSPAASDCLLSSSNSKTEHALSPNGFVDSLRPSQDDPFANLYGSGVNSDPPPHRPPVSGPTSINSHFPSVSTKGRRLSGDEQTSSSLIHPVASSSRTDQRVVNTTDHSPPSNRAGNATGSRNKRKDYTTNRGTPAASLSSVPAQSQLPSSGTRYVTYEPLIMRSSLVFFFFFFVLSRKEQLLIENSYLFFLSHFQRSRCAPPPLDPNNPSGSHGSLDLSIYSNST